MYIYIYSPYMQASLVLEPTHSPGLMREGAGLVFAAFGFGGLVYLGLFFHLLRWQWNIKNEYV